MKLIVFILSSFSLLAIKPKFCVNCKFFKRDLFFSPRYGECLKFPKYNVLDYSIVSGKNISGDVSYDYCVIVRNYENMCGKNGKFYEER
jgi:hypothetical protein